MKKSCVSGYIPASIILAITDTPWWCEIRGIYYRYLLGYAVSQLSRLPRCLLFPDCASTKYSTYLHVGTYMYMTELMPP